MTARDQVSPRGMTDPEPPVEGPARQEAAQSRALLRDAVVIVGVFLLLGLLAGLVWPHLVDPVTVTRTEQGLSTDELSLSHRFDNDGWFAVLGLAGGLLGGLCLMAWRRTHEVVSLLVVTGAAFLASWLASVVGTATGPGDPRTVLRDADVGAVAAGRVVVSSEAVYYVWPIAALVGALLVLWSPPGQRLLPWFRRS